LGCKKLRFAISSDFHMRLGLVKDSNHGTEQRE
jgi:hypothetical protein